MAKAKRATRKSGRPPNARTRLGARKAARGSAGKDAIQLLKADHREVEKWFEQFLSARAEGRRKDLAKRICQALKVHTQIEHEIFYPAFLAATGDADIHHEAEVEHDGAKKLIAQIEQAGPEDEYFHARVKVLSEMVKHHIQEEEKRGGMLAESSQSDMDLQTLGEQLRQRKAQLMGAASTSGDDWESDDSRPPEAGGSRHNSRGTLAQ